MDDVIRVVDDATRELEQLVNLCGKVAGELRSDASVPVRAAGDGSASGEPGEAAGLAETAAVGLDETAAVLTAAIGKLDAYRSFI
ncbi:hypothetical protein [Phytomonospora endophytica]|uniref:Uncharacterized protein n=1 Tax=Phytomonospora endophytica TaxID=714109 RepID=A0A841FDY3_9ACTN|nr:hypothetical protein [Phytomonospora endophytica]MBB6035481.1 hypothetical protein [Phytomonospora endophytica]GIG63766.1 hypothetical protein Pen01_00610 [Phytomonospora endophytica]